MRRNLALGLVLTALALAGCAPAADDATAVAVTLDDFSVTLGSDEVATGPIAFAVGNAGGEVHEIEVFAGATADSLPPVEDGVADVTGLDLVDEMENVVPGSSGSLVVDLDPGTYLVICNLPNHFGLGMWARLTVTG